MDSLEIFKKLTCGAKFSNKYVVKIKDEKQSLHKIKDEVKDEVIDSPSADIIKTVHKINDNEIKSESDDDGDYDSSYHSNTQMLLNSSTIAIKDEESDEDRLDNNLVYKADKVQQSTTSEKNQKRLTEIEIERINRLRNKYKINVSNKSAASPIETFDQLGNTFQISQQLLNNIYSCGYSDLTPIQMQAIPCLLNGQSVIACAQTGSGKTIAFLLPIINHLKRPKQKGFRSLILCPTRELAKQTQRECVRLVEGIGLKVHTINNINQAEQKYGPNSNQKYDILITTTNRLYYLLNKDPPLINLRNVQWLILDEADKLFESGKYNFLDQFTMIYNQCSNDKKKVGFFSATWTNNVSSWAKKSIKKLMTIIIGQRNSATNLIEQKLLFVGSEPGKLIAFRDMIRNGINPPVLVFVETKDRAQQLYSELMYDGLNIDVIHADRSQQERDNIVKLFREGKIWILICTELIGRGIDFKGVNLVINYDFPSTAISYIHRIGRTGRAGRPGKAITYFTQDDTLNLRSISRVMKNSGCEIPDYMLRMKRISKRDRKKLEKEKKPREDISAKKPNMKKRKTPKKALVNKNDKLSKKIKNGINNSKKMETTKKSIVKVTNRATAKKSKPSKIQPEQNIDEIRNIRRKSSKQFTNVKKKLKSGNTD